MLWHNFPVARTYLTNALALKNGDKVLAFNNLVDYSHALSHIFGTSQQPKQRKMLNLWEKVARPPTPQGEC